MSPFHSAHWRQLVALIVFVASGNLGLAAEVIPPAPRNHVHDAAGLLRRETATQLNAELAQFERDTSNQIVVAIFPQMQSDSSVEDYTVRVAQRWGAGTKDKRNGAVLFVFQKSRDIRIVTGYGLEAVLPDALCKQIIENEIAPRFRAGDFNGGVAAGARAIMAASRGEYRGTGRTAADRNVTRKNGLSGWMVVIIFAFILLSALGNRRRNVVFGRRGRGGLWMGGGPWIGGGGGGWGGGGGGGSFSGGGGSFGGGGAGGKW